MNTKQRRKHINRMSVIAQVEDWLDRKAGVLILRLANANNGKCFVDDKREQLRIIFPEIGTSNTDKSQVFGLVLDQQKGWCLCSFKYSRDRPNSSMISKIACEIGFNSASVPILSKLYSMFKDSGNLEQIKQISGAISLMLKSTKSLDKAA